MEIFHLEPNNEFMLSNRTTYESDTYRTKGLPKAIGDYYKGHVQH